MTRKLATVQKILAIDPIPNADKIEKATVLGWEVVVAKQDNFQVGDLVVYIEIDSIVPNRIEFDFLRDRKFRVRTIRLRKQVSQGLVMPLSILKKKKYREGQDVTKEMGVIKYDPQGDKEQKRAELLARQQRSRIKRFMSRYPWYRRWFTPYRAKRNWPKFIKKTDEDRIQLFPYICEQHADTNFIVTEKLDGQSGTYFLLRNPKRKFLWWEFGTEFVFGVCSRNLLRTKEDNSSYWTIARQYNIKLVLESMIGECKFVAIQGEIIGAGIQKNKYKLQGYDFYVFNIITENRKTIEDDIMRINALRFGLKPVPLLEKSFKLLPTIPEMVEYSKGKSTLLPVLREGVVLRNYEKNVSFKVVNPDFLLKLKDDE